MLQGIRESLADQRHESPGLALSVQIGKKAVLCQEQSEGEMTILLSGVGELPFGRVEAGSFQAT
jgi:hypothetical protein